MDESADEGEDDDGEAEQTTEQSKEIEAIRRAMAEENERVGTAQSRSSTAREEEQNRPKWSKGALFMFNTIHTTYIIQQRFM